MDCPSAQSLLDFARGRTPSGQLGGVITHVEACDPCRLALAAPAVLESQDVVGADDMSESALFTSGIQVGQTVGRYLLAQELGRGGTAVVFRARDNYLEREVALKVLTLPLDQALLREARTIVKLRHPRIVTVYDVEEIAGQLWLSMEFVRGRTLVQEVATRPPSWDTLQRWLSQIADALVHAHELGIVHRDITPANIMIDDQGDAKVMDFGFASVGGRGLASVLPLPNGSDNLGAPVYLAPERQRGEAASPRSDQYSLCAVAQFAIYGSWPVPSPARPQIDVPKRAADAIARGLSEDPDSRHDDLRGCFPAPRRSSRKWLLGLFGTAITVAIVVTVGWSWGFAGDAPKCEQWVPPVDYGDNSAWGSGGGATLQSQRMITSLRAFNDRMASTQDHTCTRDNHPQIQTCVARRRSEMSALARIAKGLGPSARRKKIAVFEERLTQILALPSCELAAGEGFPSERAADFMQQLEFAYGAHYLLWSPKQADKLRARARAITPISASACAVLEYGALLAGPASPSTLARLRTCATDAGDDELLATALITQAIQQALVDNNPQQARATLESASAVVRRLGVANRDIALQLVHARAQVAEANGDLELANRLLIEGQKLGPAHETWVLVVTRAYVLEKMGSAAQGASLLRDLLSQLAGTVGAVNESSMVFALAELLGASGQHDQAIVQARRALAIRIANLGEKHSMTQSARALVESVEAGPAQRSRTTPP